MITIQLLIMIVIIFVINVLHGISVRPISDSDELTQKYAENSQITWFHFCIWKCIDINVQWMFKNRFQVRFPPTSCPNDLAYCQFDRSTTMFDFFIRVYSKLRLLTIVYCCWAFEKSIKCCDPRDELANQNKSHTHKPNDAMLQSRIIQRGRVTIF